MKKIATWQDQNIIDELVELINDESIIASSTDTVLGLLAPLTLLGCRKLDEIKHRVDKPYLILIGSKKKMLLFCDEKQVARVQSIIDTYWPGPLTIIMPAKKGLPDYLQSQEGTVALRVPDHGGLQKLLAHFDGLFSTSANLTGEPVPRTVAQISQSIIDEVDAIVTDKHQKDEAVASTIIDCTGDEIEVVREGAITIS